MNKKIVTAGILAAVAIIALLIIPPPKGKPIKEVPFATLYPNNTVKINLSKASGGKASISGKRIWYKDKPYDALIVAKAVYKGEPCGPVCKIDTDGDLWRDKLVMFATPSINPENNVIEGFATFKIESKRLFIHIFLDEDWREKAGKANLKWGSRGQNFKAFEWNEISPGVYMDEVVQENVTEFKKGVGRSPALLVINLDKDELVKEKMPEKTIAFFFV